MIVDKELSKQIREALPFNLLEQSNAGGVRLAMLTQPALANGLYVEGFWVGLNYYDTPAEHVWIELEDKIIELDVLVTQPEAVYFPVRRFTLEQIRARLPWTTRYKWAAYLNAKNNRIYEEAVAYCLAEGREEYLKMAGAMKKYSLLQRVLQVGCLIPIGAIGWVVYWLSWGIYHTILNALSKRK